MKKILFLLLVVLAILILLISISSANNGVGDEASSSDAEKFQNAYKNKGTGKFTLSQPQTVNLPNGQTAKVSGNVIVENGEINYADNLEYLGGSFRNVRNFRTTLDGYTASSVEQLQQDGIVITNGEGVSYSKGTLKAKHVDAVAKGNSVTTNVDNLEISTKISVERADTLVSSGITISSIENTEFEISDKEIAMKSKKGSTLHITGKDYIEADFEAFSDESEIKVSKEKSEYEIKNGRLNYSTNEFTDSVETNSTAKIEIDEYGFGFKCMSLGIKSTYWYYDKKDLRRDFGINIPKESSIYKLCLRKNQLQQFKDFNGLVDFINKKIELNGIVNYLRYSFRENQLLSLLSDFVYQGFDLNDKTTLNLDINLLFLDNLFITNNNPNNNISISHSGNHEIIEIKGTRFAKIHRNKFYSDLIKQYKTEFENSIITINNKILTQNGNSKVKILSVNSPEVKKAELFLQNYWNRKQSVTLSEHLE